MSIDVVVGTRPEIIKMAPIVLGLQEAGVPYSLVHTGQHYDRELSEVFLDELGLGRPQESLSVGSGTQAGQTAKALTKLGDSFARRRPELVLVEGDTNTVLAGALAASKLGIDVAHVEAGLRSFDLRMPEEHNRRLTDHLSSYLFAPTEVSKANLERESVWGEVFVTGNTVIDSCLLFMPQAEAHSKVLEEVRFEEFCLATAHRVENVEDPETLRRLVRIFTGSPLPVVYPIHPRTQRRLREAGLLESLVASENVQLLPAKGYYDFLVLMRHCSLILTDSGGIQEEATAPNIRKKVFVLRRSTERPEAVEAGYAEVVGTDPETALSRIRQYVANPTPPYGPSPYGDGFSGRKITKIVQSILQAGGGILSGGSR